MPEAIPFLRCAVLRAVVIGATNRKQDLDPALISRFSATVTFELPTDECRCA